MNIKEAKLNIEYNILGVQANNDLHRRLSEIGIYEGGKLKIIRKSLLGHTYLLEIFGTTIAVRSSVLKGVELGN